MAKTFYQEMSAIIESDDPSQIAKFISDDRARLTADTVFGNCLHYAAEEGKLNAVKCLIDLGANVNIRGGELQRTALEVAASKNELGIVEYLLNNGAQFDLSAPINNPYLTATFENHIDIIKFLLVNGIDPHVIYRSVSGQLKNALSFAKEYNRQEIITLLENAGCRMPVEGVDVGVNESPATAVQSTSDDSNHKLILAYMNICFGPVDDLALQEILPVMDDIRVSINVIGPNDQHPYLTLFTTGMSDLPMHTPPDQEAYQYAELIMFLPANWPHPREVSADDKSLWPVQWLRQMAYYSHLNETWLGSPVAIVSSDDPPVPLGANTQQTCLMLLPDFANLQPLKLENGNLVRFYTVIPLYTQERDYELRHGARAFLERFIERKVSVVVDVERENFAT